jgi:uncharacterized protein YoxC
MFYDSWEHILIPVFGVVSIFAWFYLEKYNDKSTEDWLHTNKKMAHEALYVLSWYGTAISAAFGFIGYGLITWVGWGGFAVFDLPPFVEFQLIVVTLTLIWSQIRQDYTHALFDKVALELPYILEDEDTAIQARAVIMQVQGEMENLVQIVQKVREKLESTSKDKEALEKKLKKKQRSVSQMKQQIEQNKQMIKQTKKANDDLSNVIKDTKQTNEEMRFTLDEAMNQFRDLQTMRQEILKKSKKLQDDFNTVDLDIEAALREIENQWSQEVKEFDKQYHAASANERKILRYAMREPVLKKQNDYLKNVLVKQVKELPKASRAQFELAVNAFKRKKIQDYVICEVCKQPKKDGCTCGGSGPMYST